MARARDVLRASRGDLIESWPAMHAFKKCVTRVNAKKARTFIWSGLFFIPFRVAYCGFLAGLRLRLLAGPRLLPLGLPLLLPLRLFAR